MKKLAFALMMIGGTTAFAQQKIGHLNSTEKERKLDKSGLVSYFHHIEIVSEKRKEDYLKLIKHLDIKPQEFVMIGHSLKSDVLPVLDLGGFGIHVPFHTTWEHDKVDIVIENTQFYHAEKLNDIINLFKHV